MYRQSAVARWALCSALALAGTPVSAALHAPSGLESLIESLVPTPLLLVGEQHDAPAHQALQRDLVQTLSGRGQLAALVMEMIDHGRQVDGLPRDADEATVRAALHWTDEHSAGWPWAAYGPVVMAAVRAGVPVVGGNLPRADMRAVMADRSLDDRLAPEALAQQRASIRDGHCGLLPETQIEPMTRIQIARDRSMAQAALARLTPGQTVLLVAGNGHVRRDLGIPLHLGPLSGVRVLMAQAGSPAMPGTAQPDAVWPTPAVPARDHCAELKRQMGR
jgi:uncharacterized iron-regulated protein